MKHAYELKKLKENGSFETVMEIIEEPKEARRKAKEYAEREPGLYSLKRVEEITVLFTEKRLDSHMKRG